VASDVQHCVQTLRLKVKREGYAWLNAAAIEVNQVRNFSNAAGYKAARPFSGQPRWLSAFDLDKLTAGATECFDHIGADTIQRVNAEFATRRKQFRKAKLRWRVSKGPKKSLGWVPFKAVQLSACGVTHDRNVNAGRNIRSAGRCPPSVCGNEPPLIVAPPSQTSSRMRGRD
jgi:hypothetical protein